MTDDGATGDSRMGAHMEIGRDEEGYRCISVNGKQFPTWTRGEISVIPQFTGCYRDSRAFWPAHPDDVYLKGEPGDGVEPYGYEVVLTLFVDQVTIHDPAGLEERFPQHD